MRTFIIIASSSHTTILILLVVGWFVVAIRWILRRLGSWIIAALAVWIWTRRSNPTTTTISGIRPIAVVWRNLPLFIFLIIIGSLLVVLASVSIIASTTTSATSSTTLDSSDWSLTYMSVTIISLIIITKLKILRVLLFTSFRVVTRNKSESFCNCCQCITFLLLHKLFSSLFKHRKHIIAHNV